MWTEFIIRAFKQDRAQIGYLLGINARYECLIAEMGHSPTYTQYPLIVWEVLTGLTVREGRLLLQNVYLFNKHEKPSGVIVVISYMQTHR